MSKKVVAVSLSGVLVDSRVWKKAHEEGMKEHFEVLGINGVPEGKSYFDVVDEATAKVWPGLGEEERVVKRRMVYFERVLRGIRDEDVNFDVIEFLETLKDRFMLVLITTNDEKSVEDILGRVGASDLFDRIFVSELSEKDDKVTVFRRAVEEMGRVDVLVESGEKLKGVCEESGVLHVGFDGVEGLREIFGWV